MNANEIIADMTLEEKTALCSGEGYWKTKGLKRLGINALTICDGPHGLRKQTDLSDNLGLHRSIPATSFPTACTSACSWDRELLYLMGEALGEECLKEGVSVILGPGANIKRNPLCGRNFEYFSEDPYLSGELAASWIKGVQDLGVGASLKHFAGNNQENRRGSNNSIIDERALREIYLAGFEKAVKKAQPATVMSAYNMLNGTYCSDNKRLLKDILREEWGFEGLVVSDWGGTHDRVEAFRAGMDLEMPGSDGFFDKEVVEAVRTGRLEEKYIDESVRRILKLTEAGSTGNAGDTRSTGNFRDTGSTGNAGGADKVGNSGVSGSTAAEIMDRHHRLAARIAAESAVLLKNEGGLLPLTNHKNLKIGLFGGMAKEMRYQGAGSSYINPYRLVNVAEGL
ncbi:MAG: glycoside hydrolase family 3 protein, partial [Clostridiales bacterium]|nr:glycoside hydrolase family 3 protein [Clostridiales bacterium]